MNDLEMIDNNLESSSKSELNFEDPNISEEKLNDNNLVQIEKLDLLNLTPKKLLTLPLTRRNTFLEKKFSKSPIVKKKNFKATSLKKTRKEINERLYPANKNRGPSYKTMAELVHEFDLKTRVYENENYKNEKFLKNGLHKIIIPKSPNLLTLKRNRARTVLSSLEQDELMTRSNKITFKAQPLNKKIFKTFIGVPRIEPRKPSTFYKFDFHSELEKKSEDKKSKCSKEHNTDNQFVFKARPMPTFKNVPIMMRNRTIKKQTSDKQLIKEILNENNSKEANYCELDKNNKQNHDVSKVNINENVLPTNLILSTEKPIEKEKNENNSENEK